MLFGQGRPRSGNDIFDSCLVRGNYVHLSLNHYGGFSKLNGSSGLMKIIEDMTLMKNCRFWGVEIFGFLIGAQSSAGKADDIGKIIKNRKDNSMEKPIGRTSRHNFAW